MVRIIKRTGRPILEQSSGNSSNNNSNNNNNKNNKNELAVPSAAAKMMNVGLEHVEAKTRSNIPSLVCATMASLTTGATTYAFGLYGSTLKRDLHLSQAELDTISTAFFFAGLFSWMPGLLADKFGTRFTMSMGAMMGATNLMLYWFVARKFIALEHHLLVPVLSVLGISIFLSNACVTGSVFKTIVAVCGPGTKGSAVGAAKGYVGLGAGVYSSIFQAIRRKGESKLDFLPMAAFLAITCAAIPALLLLPTYKQAKSDTFEDHATPLHFRTMFCSLIFLATFIVGTSLMELMDKSTFVDLESTNQAALKDTEPSYGTAILLLGLWLGPILSCLYLPRHSPSSTYQTLDLTDHDEDEADLQAPLTLSTDESRQEARLALRRPSPIDRPIKKDKRPDEPKAEDSERDPTDQNEGDRVMVEILTESDTEPSPSDASPPDLNLAQMLMTPSAVLMLWTTTILVGAGIVMTNNFGQMTESLGFRDGVTTASVALFSVAQAVGRVMTGAVSESALDWNTKPYCGCCSVLDNGIPRPFFLVLAALLGGFAHFVLGVASTEWVFVAGAALAGAAFGSVWPLMVLISAEIFGNANAGANYMFFDGFSSAIGTLLLSRFVAQEVYDSHIAPDAKDPNTCMGEGCFQSTHAIISILSFICVATSFGLLYSSRQIYSQRRDNLHVS